MPIVAYLCDRHACSECSYPTCMHTTDIDHAVNFQHVSGSRWREVPKVESEEADNNDNNLRGS